MVRDKFYGAADLVEDTLLDDRLGEAVRAIDAGTAESSKLKRAGQLRHSCPSGAGKTVHSEFCVFG